MKNLFILEIQLLSQKEKKARKIIFDKTRTLIHGKNHTGKSSLIKSIYQTLGAEPLINPKFKNANVTSVVTISADNTVYKILRDGKMFAIFDGSDTLISKFDSVTKGLGLHLSQIFNFHPLFESSSKEFIIPPPAYLFLPYYIDQDNSWNKSWSSFKRLQQFKDYKKSCINYHAGIRPNEYYITKKEIEKYITSIEEIEREKDVTSKILRNIREKLNQTEFNIDLDAFKSEITQLLIELEILKKKQEKLKSKLLELYNIKAVLDSQIEIVKLAISENQKDFNYAMDTLPSVVDCPTCGAEYSNSFSERFEIARDEQKSKDLLLELHREAKQTSEEIENENSSLSITTAEMERINAILEQRKEGIQFKDVIENAGKNQVKDLFQARTNELQTKLIKDTLEKNDLEKKLKAYENRDRREQIIEFYRTKMTEFLKKLDVHSLNYDDYKNIFTAIEDKETGSARPRALMAYYFTFFHLMQKYSSSIYCPLIIDSPNQQDQDIEHIDKIMDFINNNQPPNSQMILGLAETYGVDFKCKTIELNEPYGLLSKDEYDEVYSEISPKLDSIWLS